jgi:hypothetical protein
LNEEIKHLDDRNQNRRRVSAQVGAVTSKNSSRQFAEESDTRSLARLRLVSLLPVQALHHHRAVTLWMVHVPSAMTVRGILGPALPIRIGTMDR